MCAARAIVYVMLNGNAGQKGNSANGTQLASPHLFSPFNSHHDNVFNFEFI